METIIKDLPIPKEVIDVQEAIQQVPEPESGVGLTAPPPPPPPPQAARTNGNVIAEKIPNCLFSLLEGVNKFL